MKLHVCPHCETEKIRTPDVPADVVAVVRCPECHQLVVLFRDEATALSHKTLQNQTSHLAKAIAEFLEAGMSFLQQCRDRREEGVSCDADFEVDAEDEFFGQCPAGPIEDKEVERFVKTELMCLDDPSYFRKHFG